MYTLDIPRINPSLKMQVHEAGDAYISRDIREKGLWEPEETQFILSSLCPGMSFVDVGANIGYFSLLASRMVGEQGKVFAFEPDPANFELLQKNCALNDCDNVGLYKKALSNGNATGSLYLSEFNKGDHTIYECDGQRDSIPIELVRGGDFFSGKLDRIDFLKVDTQGAEYQVLDGLDPIIKASLPGLILLVEFSPNSVVKTGVDPEAFLHLFDDLGGNFYLLSPRGLIPISRQDLERWTKFTRLDSGSKGYINIVFSGLPLEQCETHTVLNDLGFFDGALEYLLGTELAPWDGRVLKAQEMQESFLFPLGWSFMEDWGIWSEGFESRLKCILADGLMGVADPMLCISGRYFGEPEQTEVFVNGCPLGKYDLTDAKLPVKAEQLLSGRLDLRLVHRQPLKPCDLGQGTDDRSIKFGIESIGLDVGASNLQAGSGV